MALAERGLCGFEGPELLHARKALLRRAQTLMRGAEDAEDVVQETLFRALARRETFTAGSNGLAWMSRILNNLVVDRWRQMNRHPHDPLEPDTLVATTETSVEPQPWWQSVSAGQLEEAVAALREPFRTTFELHHRKKAPYDVIAAELGVPVGTVATRLHRARGQLKASLFASGDPGVRCAA